jgi:PAS domain S-box-containing protein
MPTETGREEQLIEELRTLRERLAQRPDAPSWAGEEQFRQLVESIPQVVWVNLPDGTVEYLNRRCLDYFGVSPQQMWGWDWRQGVHPDDLPRTLTATAHTMQTGEPLQVEYRLRRHDGQYRWHIGRATALRDQEGRVVKWFGAATDIHERKEAEDRLREARRQSEGHLALLDTFLRNAPAAFAVIDRDFRYARVNDALAALNGRPSADHLGRTVEEVVPDLWPRVGPILRRVLAGGEAVTDLEVSREVPAPPGGLRHGLVSFYPVRSGGEVRGVGVIIHDVTERRRLEEQYRQAQKMEAVGLLAGGVAHDFNNALTVICGCGHVVLGDLPVDSPSRSHVGEMVKAGERAAALIRQLLAFSRKAVLAPRVLDLNGVVAGLEGMLRRLLGEDVELATRLQPGLGRVRADRGQLEQALLNLAANARDAMPRGGRLTVETRDAGPDECRGLPPCGPADSPLPCVLLAVTDTGQGMTPEAKARVFEPFFTTKEKGKGTGLGLAMVHGFVRQSGGHVEVESEVGRGTTFKLYLPRTGEPATLDKPHPVPQALQRGSETVLLAEDDPAVRALSRHALRAGGYKVLEAGDGAEAVHVAEAYLRPIHLLVTDVVMPGVGGRELAERLLALHPEARVLFTSGYTDDAVVRHGVLEEQVHFLHKPFTPADLAQKVREVLDSSGPS